MKKSILVIAAVFTTLGLFAQEPPARDAAGARNQDPWSAGTFTDFRLRAVGPALMSGRISAIAVHPDDKQTWYIGVASGGVWKTTNAGITWTPVFQDRETSAVVRGRIGTGHQHEDSDHRDPARPRRLPGGDQDA
jgi:hypothetical protein